MFFDHVSIEVKSGKGGDGAVTFRREKYVPDGGPDGGDGGKGGDVILRATNRKNTLLDYRFKHHFAATNGETGRKRKQSGKQGENLVLLVPCGTLVYDEEHQKLIKDLRHDGDEVVVARGGKGGLGNVHFKNSVRQAPKFGRAGGAPQVIRLSLELKLIADIGLIGEPNAGKSSLLSVLSRAKPEIADYAFTTVEPQLGVVQCDLDSFVLADLPGLIEGASQGMGLGYEFLRHTARCRVLLHVVNGFPKEGEPEPIDSYHLIRNELESYDPELGRRHSVVVINKSDLLDPAARSAIKRQFELEGIPIQFVSAVSHEGVEDLKTNLMSTLIALPEPTVEEAEYDQDWLEYRYTEPERFRIEKRDGTTFVVGDWIEQLVRSINFNDPESFHYFQRQIQEKGVNSALQKSGVQEGEWIDVGGAEFQFVPGEQPQEERPKRRHDR